MLLSSLGIFFLCCCFIFYLLLVCAFAPMYVHGGGTCMWKLEDNFGEFIFSFPPCFKAGCLWFLLFWVVQDNRCASFHMILLWLPPKNAGITGACYTFLCVPGIKLGLLGLCGKCFLPIELFHAEVRSF